MKPTFIARFIDGPMGGQETKVSEPRPRVYFPSVFRGRIVSDVSLDLPPGSPLTTEEYELRGRRGDLTRDTDVLEYVWVNPSDHLREEVRRLQSELHQARAVKDAVTTLGRALGIR